MKKYVGAMVRKSIRVQIAAEGERFEVDDVLRITKIRIQFRLDAENPDRDAIDRALESYAGKCPAYQSIKGCIECSWGLEIVRAA
ncbi:OsmC family protein [uncultured Sulfitobacter sp.]|uniref:OsmC family protein n=1 Tax=uncultured Sulfitobacter sp. TaxID=191468 RepID=UPI0025990694|nr:OsmC family protein [uncultured Sulfitobacter sp.]